MKKIFGLVLALFLSVFAIASAETVVSDTLTTTTDTVVVEPATTSVVTDEVVVAEATTTEDAVVAEAEDVSEKDFGAFGLFWRGVRENVSMAFTFNVEKKVEKALKYAEQRMRLAEKMAEKSDDPKVQAKASQMAERAQKFIERAEDSKEKILNNSDLLKEIGLAKINREKMMEKMVDILSPEQIEKLKAMEERMKDRDQKFLDGIVNNGNVPIEVKAKILEQRAEVEARRTENQQFKEEHKDLIEKAKAGDEEATKMLMEEKNKIMEARKKENEARKEQMEAKMNELKADLEAKAKVGDADAIKKLEIINQREVNIQNKENFKEIVEKAKAGDLDAMNKLREGKEKIKNNVAEKVNAIKANPRVEEIKKRLMERRGISLPTENTVNSVNVVPVKVDANSAVTDVIPTPVN